MSCRFRNLACLLALWASFDCASDPTEHEADSGDQGGPGLGGQAAGGCADGGLGESSADVRRDEGGSAGPGGKGGGGCEDGGLGGVTSGGLGGSELGSGGTLSGGSGGTLSGGSGGTLSGGSGGATMGRGGQCAGGGDGAKDGAPSDANDGDPTDARDSGGAESGDSAPRNGTWSVPELIGGGGVTGWPEMAVGSNGTTLAVWEQRDDEGTQIWANRSVPSHGWDGARPIGHGVGDARLGAVVVDSAGNGTAVWQQSDGTRNHPWANRFGVTGWDGARRVDTSDVESGSYPQVTVDANGNVTAVWMQFDGTKNTLWANRFVPAVGWGEATRVAEDSEFPRLAVDATGDVTAVWIRYDSSAQRNTVWANRFVPAVGWDAPTSIDSGTGDALSVRVAGSSSGPAMAVWADGKNVWANRFAPGVAWEGARAIDGNSEGESVQMAELAADSNGNALVVWEQTVSSHPSHIWGNRFVSGLGWEGAFPIEASQAGDAMYPVAAMSSDGSAMVAWQASDGHRDSIWAKRFVPALGWGEAVLIENNEADASLPRLALDASGNAMVVWKQGDGMWANCFTSAP